MKQNKALGMLALAMACGGCSITGVSGSGEFSCAAGEGVPCQSISGINANYAAGNLPFQRDPSSAEADSSATGKTAEPYRKSLNYHSPEEFPTARAAQPGQPGMSPSALQAPTSGTPIRTPERLLRVWYAPANQPDGTLLDQSYAYIVVSPGRWLMDTNVGTAPKVPVVTRIQGSDSTPPKEGESPAKQANGLAKQVGAGSASRALSDH